MEIDERKPLDIDQLAQRSKEAPWTEPYKKLNILLVGAGGIISNTIIPLIKNEPNRVTIVDPDQIEIHNLGNQFYSMNSLSNHKAMILKNIGEFMGNYYGICSKIKTIEEYISSEHYNFITYSNIIISGVDNMIARKNLFKKILEENCCRFLICSRQSAEDLFIYTVDLSNEEQIERYQKEALFDDSEANELACGFKATMHTGQMNGALIVGILNNFISNQGRNVPFLTHFNFPLMMFRTFY